MTIGIVGAGISGLTLAYELQQRGVDYYLWEATSHTGGYIQSKQETGANGNSYLLERGPNSLLGNADLLQWLDTLGLTAELTFANPVSKARYIFRNGQYRALPSGPPSLLLGNFFSWQTKWAVFRERNNKTTSPEGETLGQFFRRRFSAEIVDYALGPFVAGIYAGDPEQLLVSETFPQLLQYERDYGSVLRGFIKAQSATGGAALGRRQSFSFRNGMQTLPDALARQLTSLTLNNPAQRISPTANGGWLVESATGPQRVDRLVLAVGTDAASRLMAPVAPDFADALDQVIYPPMTAVHSVYKRADVRHPLNGFGGLNPNVEGRFAAGHIWSSSVFEGRCPADEVLFTTFVGGRQSPEAALLADDLIFQRVHQELADGFGIRSSAPVHRSITRWARAIPQYDKAIVAVREEADKLAGRGLLVCANWYKGVSLSDCINKARQLATELTSEDRINKF